MSSVPTSRLPTTAYMTNYLPSVRVPTHHPFMNVGMDYGGPILFSKKLNDGIPERSRHMSHYLHVFSIEQTTFPLTTVGMKRNEQLFPDDGRGRRGATVFLRMAVIG